MGLLDSRLMISYISNLRVEIIMAGFTHCSTDWKCIDYIPQFNKLYLICEGEGWVKIGDREYYPKPGQIYLFPYGVKQSYSAINSNTYTKYWCHFKAKVGENNLFDMIDVPTYLDLKDMSFFQERFADITNNYNNMTLTSLMKMKAALLDIIAFYIEKAEIEDVLMPSTKSSEVLKKLLQLMDSYLHEDITIETMAKHVHLHPNYLIKLFKTHMGISPAQYLRKIRVERAKQLLTISDMCVTDIAVSTGFSDIFHFSNMFKNHTGYAPTEFRKLREKQTGL